jgi:transposase
MNFKLTDTDREALRKFQRNVSDRSGYLKVTTLLLLDTGLSISEISEYLGIDDSTIYRYVNAYQKKGLSAYLQADYQGYWGRMSSIQI